MVMWDGTMCSSTKAVLNSLLVCARNSDSYKIFLLLVCDVTWQKRSLSLFCCRSVLQNCQKIRCCHKVLHNYEVSGSTIVLPM